MEGRQRKRLKVTMVAVEFRQFSHTKRVDCRAGQEVRGVRFRNETEPVEGALSFMTFPHTCSDPQETQPLKHSDFMAPHQLGRL